MKILILILSLAFSNLVYANSLYTETSSALLLKEDVAARRSKEQKDVSRMYFFVHHIDEVDTLEKIKLEAFLLGLKEGFDMNFYMEKKAFGRAWFCHDKTPFYGRKSNDYIVNLIKWVYKNYPDRFSKDVGIYSHISSALAFGLQVNYRCNKTIKEHIAGYNYSNLRAPHPRTVPTGMNR